jgi:hypothetical protein
VPDYEERLYAPVGWWLVAVVCVVVLGAELWAGSGWVAAVVCYVALAAICGAFLWHWSSARVRVTGGELSVGQARLPLRHAGEVVTLDERQTRKIRGPEADPSAFLFIRPYLRRSVYVEVADGESAAPYWLIGTRRPAELAAAIERSRTARA